MQVIIGHQLIQHQNFLNMVLFFHVFQSYTVCSVCGQCVNCIGINELCDEFIKHKFYDENANVTRWPVWYDNGLEIEPQI